MTNGSCPRWSPEHCPEHCPEHGAACAPRVCSWKVPRAEEAVKSQADGTACSVMSPTPVTGHCDVCSVGPAGGDPARGGGAVGERPRCAR